MNTARPDLFIADTDAQALNRLLLDSTRRESEEFPMELAAKLFDAQVLAPRALPHGTVRLNSTVTYKELPSGRRRRVTLVSPQQADADAGRISIFSPIGRELLGNVVGRVVRVTLPSGQELPVRIVDVEAPDQAADEAPAREAATLRA